MKVSGKDLEAISKPPNDDDLHERGNDGSSGSVLGGTRDAASGAGGPPAPLE